MPQAVQPGSYSSAYGQQLQKTIMTMASNPSMTAAMLTPNPMMMQADYAIGNTIGDIDTQMAAVGISLSPFGSPVGYSPYTSYTSGLTSPLGGLGGGLTSPFGGMMSPMGGMGGGLTSPFGGMTSPLGGLGMSSLGSMSSPLGGMGMSSPLGDMSGGMMGQSNPLSAIMALLYQIMNMIMGLGSQQGMSGMNSGGLGLSGGGFGNPIQGNYFSTYPGLATTSPLLQSGQFSGLA